MLCKLSFLYQLYLRSTSASAGAERWAVALGSAWEQLKQEAEAFFNLFIFSSPPSPGDFCVLDGASMSYLHFSALNFSFLDLYPLS